MNEGEKKGNQTKENNFYLFILLLRKNTRVSSFLLIHKRW